MRRLVLWGCRCGIAVAPDALMSRSAHALDLRSDDRTHDAAESGEHALLTETTRFAPFQLEAVLRAEAAAAAQAAQAQAAQATAQATARGAPDETVGADDDDPEPTLTVSPDENMRLLTRAFRSTDDEITLEAPVVTVPADVPSPLGDEPASVDSPPVVHDPVSVPGDAGDPRGSDAAPDSPLLAPEALIDKVSGIRRCVTPDHAEALRLARDAARIVREEEAKTRLIVIGIWGTAVTLTGLLAFFALVP